MAVAAFRSTTKRNCSIGSRDDSSSQSQPPTPHKRGHRRSKSVSDSSPRYFSDSGSGGDGRCGPAERGARVRPSWSRQLSSDSESEAEGYGQPRRYQRTSLDFGSLRRDIARGDKSRNCCGLRRSSSQLDLSTSQAGVVCRHGERISDGEQSKDGREVQVEEKTIRAVHAQMKIKHSRAADPLENDPPSGEPEAISLYNAMRAEVRKAVADLRIELEQSVGKEPLSPGASSGETSPGSVQTEVFQAVAEVRREFAAKLEQSEKRAQELWAQLAIEEKRCLDLVKFVKEMLPACGSQHVKRGPLERQMLRRCADKQWVSKTLDEDARRYFEECVSISGLDADGQDSSSSGKQEMRICIPGRTVRSSPSAPSSPDRKLTEALLRGSDVETHSISTVRSPSSELSLSDSQDGLVLPWLDWETEVDSGPKQGRNQNIHKDASSGTRAHNWDRNQVPNSSVDSTMIEFRGFSAGIDEAMSAMSIDGRPSVCAGGDNTARMSDPSPGSFKRRWHRWKHGSKAEEYVVQRIRFRHRIGAGRLHICGGKRL